MNYDQPDFSTTNSNISVATVENRFETSKSSMLLKYVVFGQKDT